MRLFTGNMWGKCDNGTEGLGCGLPETFRNCADVKIVTSTSGLPPQFIHNRPQQNYYSSALRGDDLRIAPQIYYPLVVKYVWRVPPSICRLSFFFFSRYTHAHTFVKGSFRVHFLTYELDTNPCALLKEGNRSKFSSSKKKKLVPISFLFNQDVKKKCRFRIILVYL